MKLILLVFCLSILGSAKAEGWLREKIKDRVMKKQVEKRAPEAIASTETKIETSGTYTFHLKQAGLDRYYIVHVPKIYDSKKSHPLLIALHGGGGSMQIQANDEYYKQISKSEKEGYVVAFPNGFSKFRSGDFATWNAGNCCGDARDKKVDDVAFIKQVIQNLKNQLNIDSKRIFADGMSNGGMMAYRLACELTDQITAIASVAGTDNTQECKPTRPISILHIHAKDDDHVLFDGGRGPKAADAAKVTDFTSVKATMTKWAKLNSCKEAPSKVFETDGAICEAYSGCNAGVKVQLCVTSNGGHSWPGGVKPRGNQVSSKAIDANAMIWSFFNDYSIH